MKDDGARAIRHEGRHRAPGGDRGARLGGRHAAHPGQHPGEHLQSSQIRHLRLLRAQRQERDGRPVPRQELCQWAPSAGGHVQDGPGAQPPLPPREEGHDGPGEPGEPPGAGVRKLSRRKGGDHGEDGGEEVRLGGVHALV